ncbi:TIGR00297 family protein [Coleofasciculus sp.]|uniref:TIGR00297 family protein n=1 Tax=Coleofasciculus sp. TaxID=3100458 RepID=UPI0039F9B2C0
MLATLNSLNPWLIAVLLNTILLAIAWVIPKQLLTPAGLLHAGALGIVIWGTLGWQGYLIVMVYFLVGSAVTRIGMAQKEAAGIAEKRSGARGPENVWGSALTGTLCAVGVLFLDEPYPSFLLLGFVASFATKLSDTTASEVGKAYGKRTFLITTLQPVSPGTEGAVSLEGTLAGAVASAVIAFLGWGVGFIDLTEVWFCVFAAFIATNLESVIGATWQSQVEWMTNEVVNFINTLIGAIAAILFVIIWHSIMGLPG